MLKENERVIHQMNVMLKENETLYSPDAVCLNIHQMDRLDPSVITQHYNWDRKLEEGN